MSPDKEEKTALLDRTHIVKQTQKKEKCVRNASIYGSAGASNDNGSQILSDEDVDESNTDCETEEDNTEEDADTDEDADADTEDRHNEENTEHEEIAGEVGTQILRIIN